MVNLKKKNASLVTEEEDIFDFPDQKYYILSVKHTDEPKHVCDRCGKPITNIVRVKGKDGDVYYLGVNCAEIVGAVGVED
jgi:uncharacterized cysteine cluster protein YcgN (CxxCxxCC family)